jgi:glucosamine-6-phosphate deaminase
MTVRQIVVDDGQFGSTAADVVQSRLPRVRPRLGVATGGTPLGVYAELAHRSRSGALNLSDALVIALDEYVGLSGEHPRSYARYVREVIAGPLGIPGDSVLTPDGVAGDPNVEATKLDRRIADIGGVDVQIVGLGGNGHIGFNEPGSSFDSTTRVVELDEQTRADNARFFDGDIDNVPRRAITQGLATIMRARSILLLALGEHKATPLSAAVHGPVTTQVPASLLQRHPDVTVVADHFAAALL